MHDFQLKLSELTFTGSALDRPECVLATAAGDLFTSDARGGVMHIRADGAQQLIVGKIPGGGQLHPNGFAMLRDGSFLIANRGDGREGGVWRLYRNGRVEPFLLEVDGITLPRTNFVLLDDQDRVWISISTVHKPDYEFSPTRADGFIALVDKRGARIAGGGIVWTNECRINPAGTHMYFNETWAQRVSRFRLAPDGSLSNKEIVAELGPGNYSDGLTFDAEGGAWITCVVSNRLIRVTEDGRMQTILEDYEPDHMARAIAANAQGKLVRTLVHENHHRTLGNVSSLAFAGPDLRTAHMGSILSPHLVTFRSPVAGVPPAHWRF